jgi:hypothetical protein
MPSDEPLTLLRDLKVIGEYDDPELIVSKLQQMNDPDFSGEADVKEKGVEDILNIFNSVQNQPWSHATHQFGYIAPRQPGSTEPQAIQYPGTITADTTLKNSRINIRLDRLRIHKYPGGGIHNVLVTFAARNQVARFSGVGEFQPNLSSAGGTIGRNRRLPGFHWSECGISGGCL